MKPFLYKPNRTVLLLSQLFLFAISNRIFAQEGNNWYFGDHAGLTFNTSPPSPLYNSSLSTLEGCATISDGMGQLLFYTDGSFVYNKNHQIMANGSGLMGHPSSSNSSIIVRRPGSDSLYYIFTADAAENGFSNGYRYSIVDMSLNNGAGGVIVKNVLLYAKCSEKITAVKHANGIDTWIITKDYLGNTYKVFKLSCNGIDTNPIISNVGIPYKNIPRVGSIKASPNGDKIATTQYSFGWEIFDFDKTTGRLSSALLIPYPVAYSGAYAYIFGLEFSPNGKLIYLSTECCNNGGAISQYRIDTYDSAVITNSRFLIDSSKFLKGDMQLGPDGRIYIPNEEDSSLNVINNPDQYGAGCNYIYKAVNLGFGRNAMRCLPAFLKDNITSSVIDFSFSASQDCGTISLNGTTSLPQPVSWQWDFGDGKSAWGQSVSHSYNSNGSFTVKLTVNNTLICGANGTKTKTFEINSDQPIAGFTYSLPCGGKTINFFDTSFIKSGNVISWQWDFGDGQTSSVRNPQHTYDSFGQYRVTLKAVSQSICPHADTVSRPIDINKLSHGKIFLGKDTVLCKDSFFVLHAGPGFKNYLWQDGSMDSVFSATQSGRYFVKANDFCGNNYSDTIYLNFGNVPAIFLGNDTTMCANQPLVLNAGRVFKKYVWNSGDTTQYLTVNNKGIFSVVAYDNFGCESSDTITITSVYPAPSVYLNKNPIVCYNQNDTLSVSNLYTSCLWQDGSIGNTIKITSPGLYKIIVENSYNCFASDSVTIKKIAVTPTNFLRENATICSDDSIVIKPLISYKEYIWSTGSTNNNIVARAPSTIWLQVTDDNNCKGADTIKIFAKDCPVYFYMPNAFTPNNDGRNDVIKPTLTGHIEYYRFSIYNRYGQKVFDSNDDNKGWDGKVNGELQNADIFVWTCTYKILNKAVMLKKGTILLIK